MPWRSPWYREQPAPEPKPETRAAAVAMEDLPHEKIRMPTWMLQPPYGMIRLMKNGEVFNAEEMRILGRSSAAWQCKKIIADAVISCDWDILPTNPQNPDKTKINEIKLFMQRGARSGLQGDKFNNLTFSLVMDLLDLDAGVIAKVFGKHLPDRLVKLRCRDGSTFYKEQDLYGNILRYWQYDYRTTGNPVKLDPREITYVILNSRSDSVYGESPVESIDLVIRGLVKGMKTHEMIYDKGGIPSGILATTGMTKDEHDKFMAWWQTNMESKVYQRAMLNIQAQGTVNWIPLITSFRDMQFLDNQRWFTELVYRTFKVPHGGIGAASRQVKGELTDERRHFMKNTVKPVLTALEQMWNTDIIPHFYEKDEEPTVYFHYTTMDLMEEKEQMEVWEKKWEYGAHTINEYRDTKGLPHLPWGEFNPMALKQILSFGQTWWYGAMDDDGWEQSTGIPKPKVSEILKRLEKQKVAASKPPMQGEQQENEPTS